ncbi:uncharacterized protein LOC119832683 [Zerene cesonia]|uniref:uncharacterized protein LOC119832683 n=1 Tax=Zerene cesonia TaxID=33412 RepID=UPI0018E509E4|nr:uncharacterized protein LOC119832683 [Zerene cesonia]
MASNHNDCDAVSIVIALAVFALPVTLLIPDFSIWDVIPKIHVTRWPICAQYVTWSQLNTGFIIILTLFFGMYLEIRKRTLNEMVDTVLTVTRATETTLDEERDKQAEAVKVCVELLDVSTEHYENLILLRDDLRKRDKARQRPPAIEPSTSDV